LILFLAVFKGAFAGNRDSTSAVYFSAGVAELSKGDSLKLFIPFDRIQNASINYSSFGIRAEYVKFEVPAYQRLHIDLNKNKIKENYPWQVFFPFLVCLILILAAKIFVSGNIRRIFVTIFFNNAFLNTISEKNVNVDKAGYMLSVCYFLNAALVVMLCIYRYDYQLRAEFMTSFMTIILVVAGFYIVKRIISGMLAGMFVCRDIFALYYKYNNFLLQALGVVLTVLNAVSFYVTSAPVHEFAFYSTVVLCIFAEILKIFKLFSIIFEKHFPIFYLFLYLCGVEFLPAVYVVKILSD
jgi:hypothetical protein